MQLVLAGFVAIAFRSIAPLLVAAILFVRSLVSYRSDWGRFVGAMAIVMFALSLLR